MACSESPAKTRQKSEPINQAPIFAWYECGEKLAKENVKSARAALFLLATESVDTSPEFLMFATLVMAAESGFNKAAISPSKAIGLMQVTPIGAREAEQQCNLPYSRTDSEEALIKRLLIPKVNIKYGTCLLNYYMNQVNGNQVLATILYNGGYKQLTRFIETGTLNKETLEYVLRVQSFYGRCIR